MFSYRAGRAYAVGEGAARSSGSLAPPNGVTGSSIRTMPMQTAAGRASVALPCLLWLVSRLAEGCPPHSTTAPPPLVSLRRETSGTAPEFNDIGARLSDSAIIFHILPSTSCFPDICATGAEYGARDESLVHTRMRTYVNVHARARGGTEQTSYSEAKEGGAHLFAFA